MKRIALFLTVLAETFATAREFTYEGVTFRFQNCQGGVEIAGLADRDVSGEVKVPARIDGVPVVGIGKGAFCNRGEITNVILPEGILRIKESAFEGCDRLTSFVIPNGVLEIDDWAFAWCKRLVPSRIPVPPSVKNIGVGAFDCGWNFCPDWKSDVRKQVVKQEANGVLWCYEELAEEVELVKGLDKKVAGVLAIPSHFGGKPVRSIGGGAFSDLEEIVSVTVPETVNRIGRNAFRGCTGLKDVKLPNGITMIRRAAFAYCKSLSEVRLPRDLMYVDDELFQECTALRSVSLGENMWRIGRSAFSGCCELRELEIPEGVRRIESSAFSGCDSFRRLNIPKSVISIGERAFPRCVMTVHADNPTYCLVDGLLMDKGRSLILHGLPTQAEVRIPGTVKRIGAGAFSECGGIRTVEFPRSLSSIGNGAFGSCTGLVSAVFCEGIAYLGDYAFYDCCNLKKVKLPQSVYSIGMEAFSGCRGLISVGFANDVHSVGQFAFVDCVNLTDVTLPTHVKHEQGYLGASVLELNQIAAQAHGARLPLEKGESDQKGTRIGGGIFSGCVKLAEHRIVGNMSFADAMKLAREGRGEGYYALAVHCACGNETERDVQSAVALLDRAIDAGNANAVFVKGLIDESRLAGSDLTTEGAPGLAGMFAKVYGSNIRSGRASGRVNDILRKEGLKSPFERYAGVKAEDICAETAPCGSLLNQEDYDRVARQYEKAATLGCDAAKIRLSYLAYLRTEEENRNKEVRQ